MIRIKGISSFGKRNVSYNCALTISKKMLVARFKRYIKRRVQYDIKEAIKEATRHFEEELTPALAEYY